MPYGPSSATKLVRIGGFYPEAAGPIRYRQYEPLFPGWLTHGVVAGMHPGGHTGAAVGTHPGGQAPPEIPMEDGAE